MCEERGVKRGVKRGVHHGGSGPWGEWAMGGAGHGGLSTRGVTKEATRRSRGLWRIATPRGHVLHGLEATCCTD